MISSIHPGTSSAESPRTCARGLSFGVVAFHVRTRTSIVVGIATLILLRPSRRDTRYGSLSYKDRGRLTRKLYDYIAGYSVFTPPQARPKGAGTTARGLVFPSRLLPGRVGPEPQANVVPAPRARRSFSRCAPLARPRTLLYGQILARLIAPFWLEERPRVNHSRLSSAKPLCWLARPDCSGDASSLSARVCSNRGGRRLWRTTSCRPGRRTACPWLLEVFSPQPHMR